MSNNDETRVSYTLPRKDYVTQSFSFAHISIFLPKNQKILLNQEIQI